MSEVQEYLINRQKLLAALRSKQYHQCFGVYYEGVPTDKMVCAIGMAYHVVGSGNDEAISNIVQKKYKLSYEFLKQIIELNDSGMHFEEIADYIEKANWIEQ